MLKLGIIILVLFLLIIFVYYFVLNLLIYFFSTNHVTNQTGVVIVRDILIFQNKISCIKILVVVTMNY